jgi:hypothetical protein
MIDPTGSDCRQMLFRVNALPEVAGFMTPMIIVRRRAYKMKESLKFQASP